jgi:hypothetical protein
MQITTTALYLGVRKMKKKDGSGVYALIHTLPLEGFDDEGNTRYSFGTNLAYIPLEKAKDVLQSVPPLDTVKIKLRLTEKKDSVSWFFVGIETSDKAFVLE